MVIWCVGIKIRYIYVFRAPGSKLFVKTVIGNVPRVPVPVSANHDIPLLFLKKILTSSLILNRSSFSLIFCHRICSVSATTYHLVSYEFQGISTLEPSSDPKLYKHPRWNARATPRYACGDSYCATDHRP